METTTQHDLETRIPGWGVDRKPESRPGYPLYKEYRAPHDTLQGESPARETVPLKGLSGILRRAAYRAPDWKARRWILLMVADRIDALESRLTPRNLLIAGGIGGVIAAAALRRRRR